MEDNFSTDRGGGWFGGDSNAIHLLYTLFLFVFCLHAVVQAQVASTPGEGTMTTSDYLKTRREMREETQ